VAENLLQKTSAERIVQIYETFLLRYPNLAALAESTETEVAQLLAPLGLHFRAARLCEAARRVLDEYGGEIPNTFAQLLSLPGVGEYTANAICASAFDRHTPVLDINVARVLGRFFGLEHRRLPQRDPTYREMTQHVAPATDVGAWNLTLLDFGALVCRARAPHCSACPLQQRCLYRGYANISGDRGSSSRT
jgi:A/G-specific adenine glycosylase